MGQVGEPDLITSGPAGAGSRSLDITIAICTWNRSPSLKRTLERLCDAEVPEQLLWEVVVVNNNSTDDTSVSIRSFEGRLPIREAWQPVPGISAARNKAIQTASGRFIIFIDDDILVASTWLTAYVRAIRSNPSDGFFGGPIEPEFEGTPPAWLARSLPIIGGVFGLTRVPAGTGPLGGALIPFGGNMVIRADLLTDHAFDTRLGRTAGNLMAGEETALFHALLKQGQTGRWVEEARTRHFVPKRMQTIEHVRRYFHDWGASLASMDDRSGQPMLFGRPRWLWRQALFYEMQYRAGRVVRRPEIWVEHLRQASMAWGGLRGRPARIPPG